MPLANGEIVVKTPTDLVMSALEQISKLGDVEQAVILLARKIKNEDGGTDYCVRISTTSGVFETIGIIEMARDDMR